MEHPYNPPKTDQALCQAIQENIAYIQTFPPQRLMVMLQPSLLEASLAERTARFQYPIQDWMLNAVNIVHGGVIMAIMEAYARPKKDFYAYHIGNGEWLQGVYDGETIQIK